MAKKLEACQAEFKKLQKDAEDAQHFETKYATFTEKSGALTAESVRQIGRRVQVLKDGGAKGTSLSDFANDGEVKTCVKLVDDITVREAELLREYQGALGDYKKAFDGCAALRKELETEIATRKTKKVAFVKIDSKSLPDLEKLLKTIDGEDLANDRWHETTQPDKPGRFRRQFDKEIVTELAKTKEAKASGEQAELDAQGLNERVLTGNFNKAQTLFTVVTTGCKATDEAVAAKDAAKARAALAKVMPAFKDLEAMATKYDRALADNKRELEDSKAKDKIIKMVTAISTMSKNAKVTATKSIAAFKGLGA